MVYLVGAGPGDTGLITVKAMECIKKADVIIFDYLANISFLNHAKEGCKIIYAGKIAGNHHMEQGKINELLIKYGKMGKTVVRLKGGDPFIFGRGGEEAKALGGIPYEVVPGVSSCYAAAAYAGIPVTNRGVASSFHVITGHNRELDYKKLAVLDGTLVFMMGLSNLSGISKGLIENGKSENTPVAVISNGTNETQECFKGTLKDIEKIAENAVSPSVIIVGEVVSLNLNSIECEVKKKILAIATDGTMKNIKKSIGSIGGRVTELSLIKTVVSEDVRRIDFDSFSHIVFTSKNGVNIFFEEIKKYGIDIRRILNKKFAVIGKGTGENLAEHGIFADIVPDEANGISLGEEIVKKVNKTDKLLLLRAENASDNLDRVLNSAQISYKSIGIYKTEFDYSKKDALNACVPFMDFIIFASESAKKAYDEMITADTEAKFIYCKNGIIDNIERIAE